MAAINYHSYVTCFSENCAQGCTAVKDQLRNSIINFGEVEKATLKFSGRVFVITKVFSPPPGEGALIEEVPRDQNFLFLVKELSRNNSWALHHPTSGNATKSKTENYDVKS